jgi:hypothetical protein
MKYIAIFLKANVYSFEAAHASAIYNKEKLLCLL